MKIRNGFVSNSSSSSFCIYGASISSTSLAKALGIDDEDADIEELLSKAPALSEMSYWSPEGYDEYFVGISWSKVKDDETGKQFKTRIEKAFKEVFGDDAPKVGTHQEAWYG